ncbi:MAG: polysaccharide deacetylase [Deltaproteobacteria bacterium]|nr:polysaccharide deacetylase [Deltaproteobacteria bacterium]
MTPTRPRLAGVLLVLAVLAGCDSKPADGPAGQPPTGLAAPVSADSLKNYRVVSRACQTHDGQPLRVFRTWGKAGEERVLAVNPQTFRTLQIPAQELTCETTPGPLAAQVANSPFARTLAAATAPPYLPANHGLTHLPTTQGRLLFTVDLCPSKANFDQAFFQRLTEFSQPDTPAGAAPMPAPKPVPVALAVSGHWMDHHPQELAWLQDLARQGKLAITWVNHTYYHPIWPDEPDEQNFLSDPRVDKARLLRETLNTEKAMLTRGITPSVFFRFPGLVSRADHVNTLRELNLIPLGANAWLSKGELAVDGAIVLLHGNGNDPLGIRRAMKLLEQRGKTDGFVSLEDALTN